MQLFPAIDLRGGKVVRLTQGDYDRMTVYGEDPCAQARQFVEAGARYLHVVDLDGAKDGTLSNYGSIAALAKQGGLYIEVGGGIRTEERIEKYLSLGVDRPACYTYRLGLHSYAPLSLRIPRLHPVVIQPINIGSARHTTIIHRLQMPHL